MIRALAIALVLLLGVIAWQRGSVWKAQASATSAAAGQKSAEDDLSAAQSEIGQLTTVVAKERADAKAANALAARYEKEKTNAQTESDRLVAELRAGNSRLHDRWQAAVHTAALSQAVASASQPDGGADDRYESAGRIIGAADQCDEGRCRHTHDSAEVSLDRLPPDPGFRGPRRGAGALGGWSPCR